MIGHYLLTLTEEQEDRVLTRSMRPGAYTDLAPLGPCLVGTVERSVTGFDVCTPSLRDWPPDELGDSVECRYDGLCKRFGAPRVNAAIRNRILSNRARRELAPASRNTPLVSLGERLTP